MLDNLLKDNPATEQSDKTTRGNILGIMDYGGLERSYLLHLPYSYSRDSPAPLVIVLHGRGGNAQSMESTTGMSANSDYAGFVVVYPEGTNTTWNSVECCGSAYEGDVDDVGFLGALIDELSTKLSIDPKRVYVTGFSNGAMMAHTLGCKLSDKVAAIAPVAGLLTYPQCEPSSPVSVMIVHGKSDEVVFYGGGTYWDKHATYVSIPYAVDYWVNHNGCSRTPRTWHNSEFEMDSYSGCEGDAEVVLYQVEHMRHEWPLWGFNDLTNSCEGAPANETLNDIIWDFFKNHPKK